LTADGGLLQWTDTTTQWRNDMWFCYGMLALVWTLTLMDVFFPGWQREE